MEGIEDDLQSQVESLVGFKAKSLGPFKTVQHAAYMTLGLGGVVCFLYSLIELHPLTAAISAILAWLSWHTYWVHTDRCRLCAKLAKAQEKPQIVVKSPDVSPRRAAAKEQGLSELDMTGFAKSLGMQFDNSLPQSGTMTKVMMVTLVKEYLRVVAELQAYQAKYGPLGTGEHGSMTLALPPELLAGLSMMPSDQAGAPQGSANPSPEASARSDHQAQASSRSVSQAEYESREGNSQPPVPPDSPPRSTSHSRQTSPDKPPRCAPSNDGASNGHTPQEPTFMPEPRTNLRTPVAQDFAESQAVSAGPPSRRADMRSMTQALGGPGGPGGPGVGTPGLGAGIPSLDGGLAPRRAGTMSVEPVAAAQPESKEEPWRPRCFRATDAQQAESEEPAKTEAPQPQYKGLFGQGAPPPVVDAQPEPAKPVHYGLFGAR